VAIGAVVGRGATASEPDGIEEAGSGLGAGVVATIGGITGADATVAGAGLAGWFMTMDDWPEKLDCRCTWLQPPRTSTPNAPIPIHFRSMGRTIFSSLSPDRGLGLGKRASLRLPA
jgi:hypothetical protein